MRSIQTRHLPPLLVAGLACAVLASGGAVAQIDPRTAPANRGPAVPRDFQVEQPPCPCQDGHWYDANRKSCVTGTGCKVPGMPNGDKGGKYFAWDGNLFLDTPCRSCARLELPLATGTADWVFADGPVASMKGKSALVYTQPPAAWGSLQGSSWVTAVTGQSSPVDNYFYELRFCLCPGFRNASLAMSLLADNGATVLLNGTQIGAVTDPNGKGFVNPPKPVSTNVQGLFKPGVNVLTVRVQNGGGYTGFLVGGQLTADAGRCPEP
jgi:hypothetical protein